MLRNFKTKAILLLASFLISGVAFAAPCAHLTLGVNPTVASHGSNVKATASVQNCSGGFEKLAIHFKATGPCNYSVGLGNVYMGFPTGATRTATLSFVVPQNVCKGTAIISARVYYDAALITSSSTTLLVQ